MVPLKDIGYPGLYLVGRTTMGWLASSASSDGNATLGFRNASRAQYWLPLATNPVVTDSSSTCQGTLTAIDQSEGPFTPGAGLKNPRGPITMRRLLRSPGSTPQQTTPSWVPPCAGPIPTGAPDKLQHPYIMVYYNNHYTSYTERDPYFLTVGWEVVDNEGSDGSTTPSILWSQPEVVLYDRSDHTDR